MAVTAWRQPRVGQEGEGQAVAKAIIPPTGCLSPAHRRRRRRTSGAAAPRTGLPGRDDGAPDARYRGVCYHSRMTFPEWFTPRHPQISVASAAAVLKLADEGPLCRSSRATARSRPATSTKSRFRRYRRQGALGRDPQAPAVHRRRDRAAEEAHARAERPDPCHLRPDVLEDLYLPYKQKRKTKAALAKEAGLEPFADWIWNCGHGMLSPAPEETPSNTLKSKRGT